MKQNTNRFSFREYYKSLIEYSQENHGISTDARNFIADHLVGDIKIDDDDFDSNVYDTVVDAIIENNISFNLYYAIENNYKNLSENDYLKLWSGIDTEGFAKKKLIQWKSRVPKLGEPIYVYTSENMYSNISLVHLYRKFCHIVGKPKGAPINQWFRGNFTVTDSTFVDTDTGDLLLSAISKKAWEQESYAQRFSFGIVMGKRVEKTDIITHDQTTEWPNSYKLYDHIGENINITSAIFIFSPIDSIDQFSEREMNVINSSPYGKVLLHYIQLDAGKY